MSNNGVKIGVMGAGGWGTSLALLLNDNGCEVTLWTHDAVLADTIKRSGENSDYLSGININKNINVTCDSADLEECAWLVNAIPTQYIRSAVSNFRLPVAGKCIINGSKGIEIHTMQRVSEIFHDAGGVSYENYAVITGPSHAEEVSRKTPTTLVTASEDILLTREVQKLFTNEYFRVYSSDDVVGCEIGGSLKNVIAIAAGIIDGLGLGDNTKAALITRGLAEISRLGIAMGANALTFSGLSGLGDLIVTCGSRHSRNRKVGEMIGAGSSLEEIISHMKMVAEGVQTTESAMNLGIKHNVEMPITEQVYKILFENVKPLTAIRDLMTRQSKREWWW